MNAGSSKSCKQRRQAGRELLSVLCGSELWIKGKDEKPQASTSNSAIVYKFNMLQARVLIENGFPCMWRWVCQSGGSKCRIKIY